MKPFSQTNREPGKSMSQQIKSLRNISGYICITVRKLFMTNQNKNNLLVLMHLPYWTGCVWVWCSGTSISVVNLGHCPEDILSVLQCYYWWSQRTGFDLASLLSGIITLEHSEMFVWLLHFISIICYLIHTRVI